MSTDELEHLNKVSHIYGTEAGALNRDITSYYSLQLTLSKVKGGRILQLGLGDGLIASALAGVSQSTVDVIEGSSEVIAEFGRGKVFKVINTLFEEYHPKMPYDYVIGNHILEHVADPVAIATLAHGWLCPGGTAIFTVPHANSLHRRIGVKMGLLKNTQELNAQDGELGHRRVYTLDKFQRNLQQAGFPKVAVSGYMLKMVSHKQMKDWSRELLDASFAVSLECEPSICSNIFALCVK